MSSILVQKQFIIKLLFTGYQLLHPHPPPPKNMLTHVLKWRLLPLILQHIFTEDFTVISCISNIFITEISVILWHFIPHLNHYCYYLFI